MLDKDKQKGHIGFLFTGLEGQCNPRHPIRQLAHKIPWQVFEEELSCYYSKEGRPAKPIRLMVGLLILKQMHNLSDEGICQAWRDNPYFQYFTGEVEFQWELPCEPSDLTHFRNRIGEHGSLLILSVSAGLHQKQIEKEEVVLVDTTVQEKNITYPTDTKLAGKVIERSWQLAEQENVKLRRSYRRVVKKCIEAQRGRNHPRGKKKAKQATKVLQKIAGRLVRELERKLRPEQRAKHEEALLLYKKVIKQKREDKDKVYSLHEPQVYCIAKGKEHKKYEYGSKAGLVIGAKSGVILAAHHIEKNQYDGHTLPAMLEQAEAVSGKFFKKVVGDQGFKGRVGIEGVEVMHPGQKVKEAKEKKQRKKLFKRRSSIEAVISHLKKAFRLGRNYLKGAIGDIINVQMAAAAWNFKKWMREYFLNPILRQAILRIAMIFFGSIASKYPF